MIKHIWIYIVSLMLVIAVVLMVTVKDWSTRAALFAAFGAVLAAIIAIYQASLTRMTMGADLIMRLEDRFETEELLKMRKQAAIALKGITKENEGHVEDVFDFFETVGLLVRRRALDREFAWSSFFYWLHGYYRFAKSFIEDQQRMFPNRYSEVVWLHKTLLMIEKSKGKMNESEWDKFLDEERDL